MKTFLSIAAVLAWLSGAALMFATNAFYAPFGIEVTAKVALIAQAEGAVLVGLGLITWLARSMDRFGLLAVLSGNLLTQALSLLVILRATLLGTVGGTGPGIVMHSALSLAFAYSLLRVSRPPRVATSS